MAEITEERKKSASTISDAEIIDPIESELTGWSLIFLLVFVFIPPFRIPNHDLDNESVGSTGSRRSSVSSKLKEKTLEEIQEDADAQLFTDNLHIEPKLLTQAEYDAIYTPETRAKAFVLLIYFSVLLVVIPFGSMYICYYHVFNGKTANFPTGLNFAFRI